MKRKQADTNRRIKELRAEDGLSRADLARLTGYSSSYVDNWLAPVTGSNWRRAPENAVRLLEFETGRRRASRRPGALQ